MKIEIFEIAGKIISQVGCLMVILGVIQRGLDIKVSGGDLTIVGGLVCLMLGSVLEGIKDA